MPPLSIYPLPEGGAGSFRQGSQDGREGRRRLGEEAQVIVLVGKGAAKEDLFDLGLGEACPHDDLPEATRICQGKSAGGPGLRRRNVPQLHQYLARHRERRVALGGGPDREGQPAPRPQHAPCLGEGRGGIYH